MRPYPTLDLYNRYAATNSDPALGKMTEWVKPIDALIAAIDSRERTVASFSAVRRRTSPPKFCTFPAGWPNSRLFADGRCTSGVCTGGYARGTGFSDGSFFNRSRGISVTH